MSTCNKLIEFVYNHPEINRLINSVQPDGLRDDLKQELAITLLSYDCSKIIEINETNGLIGFSIKIITNMAFSSTSRFYKKFRYNDYSKAVDYLRSQVKLPELNHKFATIASKRLSDKYGEDEQQAHEAILFTKYVELRSCKKVALFYNIPEKHVKDIIRKTRAELKLICLTKNI